MSDFKIGFACKIYTGDKKEDSNYNFNTTTVKSLTSKTQKEITETIQKLSFGNIKKLQKQIEFVLSLPQELHMFRIGSDILPLYTHDSTKTTYSDKSFISDVQKELLKIGELINKNNVRLSFHPGQFTVLGSINDNTVKNSIAELEYHTDIFRWMGFSGWHPNGLCINIHAGSKQSNLKILMSNIRKCSKELQDWITIENDEFSYSIEDLEPIFEYVPVVLDIHHQWIKTGSYFDINNDFFNKVIQSWRGVRPKIHYSVSKKEYIQNHYPTNLPILDELIKLNIKKTTLREHSDDYWNNSVNLYSHNFLKKSDIMCEAKHKNKAALDYFNTIKQII